MKGLRTQVFVFFVLMTFLFSCFAPFAVLAQDADDVNRAYEGLIWAPDGFSECAIGSFGSTELPDTVPEPYNSIFNEAAAEYGVDVAILASIFYWENRGYPEPPPPYGSGPSWPVSSAGAKGPFQFLDGTWANAGVDANGDGVKDVNDLEDASYGAANYILELGGVSGLPLGSLSDGHFQFKDNETGAVATVARVFKSYNAGPYTWRSPDSNLWLRNVGGSPTAWPPTKQNAINNYVVSASENYTAIATSGAVASSADSCSLSGSLGVSPEGFVFPLLTTKSTIINDAPSIEAYGGPWCYNNLNNCHHDYNAADIFAPTGTVVVAAKPGKVVRVVPNQVDGVGSRVFIIGIDDPDTSEVEEPIVYYYTHMGPGTIGLRLGDTVNKGEKIGEVGVDQQAVGSVRHLHFDMLPPPYTSRPSCSGAACASYPFINVQPFLVPAFENLAEG